MIESSIKSFKKKEMGSWLFLFLVGLFWVASASGVGSRNVTYDGRSLIIDGQHKILFSGSIHYPRSTPQVCMYVCMYICVCVQ